MTMYLDKRAVSDVTGSIFHFLPPQDAQSIKSLVLGRLESRGYVEYCGCKILEYYAMLIVIQTMLYKII